jgi:hypothetical protein
MNSFHPRTNSFGPRLPFYHDKDDTGGTNPEEGEGEEGDGSGIEETVRNALEDVMPQDALDAFKQETEQTGSAEAFAQTLYNENQTLREERRKLNQEVNRLKENGPEGAVVLDEETAEELESRIPEDKSVEDVPELLDKAFEAAKRLDQQERSERREEAASVAGVNEEALADLEPNADFGVEEIEDEESGETAQRATIEVDGEEKPLKSYLKDRYPTFESALFEDGSRGEEEGDDSVSMPGPSEGDETDATGGGADDQVTSWLESQQFAVPEQEQTNEGL